jgi:hypothetical protein
VRWNGSVGGRIARDLLHTTRSEACLVPRIREAATAARQGDEHPYAALRGTKALRHAVAEHVLEWRGVKIDPEPRVFGASTLVAAADPFRTGAKATLLARMQDLSKEEVTALRAAAARQGAVQP